MLNWWRGERGRAAEGRPEDEATERPATEALIPRSRRRHYPKVIMTVVLGLDEATLGPLLREMAEADAPNGAPDAAPKAVPAGAAPATPPGMAGAATVLPVPRALEPVLVTDCMNFALFRDAGLIFEYLPGAAVRALHSPRLGWSERAWEVYIARRLERLRHKWAPVRIVAIGAVARDTLARQLASPFAADDLASLTGGARPPDQAMLSIDTNNKG